MEGIPNISLITSNPEEKDLIFSVTLLCPICIHMHPKVVKAKRKFAVFAHSLMLPTLTGQILYSTRKTEFYKKYVNTAHVTKYFCIYYLV